MLVTLRNLPLLFCALLFSRWDASGDDQQPRMGIFTRPGARIDMTRALVDSAGVTKPLRDFVEPGLPFILVPIFYRCPRLCGLTVSGVIDLVNHLPMTLGDDYSVVMYSFNPDDTTHDAAEKRAQTVARLNKKPVRQGALRFLTASSDAIEALNDALGFRVRFADKEIEHSSAIFVVTPDGAVTRYFAGIEFEPNKVAAALEDATPQKRR